MSILINSADDSANFKARLVIGTKEYSRRLEVLQKKFRNATSNYPNDKLYIIHPTSDMYKDYEFKLTNKPGVPERVLPETDFKKMMSLYLDNEIAEKLVKIFKQLKRDVRCQDKKDAILDKMDGVVDDKEAYQKLWDEYHDINDMYTSAAKEELSEDEILQHLF